MVTSSRRAPHGGSREAGIRTPVRTV